MNPEQEKYVLSSSFVATVTSKCDKSREQPLNLSHYPYFYLLNSLNFLELKELKKLKELKPLVFFLEYSLYFGVKEVKEVKGVKAVSLFP